MREIKFRQYLLDKKIMLSWADLLNQEHEDSETLEATLTEKFSNASEPMQYTGLKDKNGKEIYEGDIIKLVRDLDDNDKGELITVYFSSGAFLVDCDFGEGDMAPIGWAIEDWEAGGDRFEVIGNIYEHSHLLKK